MQFKIIPFLLLMLCSNGYSQAVPIHVSNANIYEFLNELANDKIITLNTSVKPYSRELVYKKLGEAEKQIILLNERQIKELKYYMDYYKFGNEPNYLPSISKLNIFKRHKYLSTSINHLGLFYSDSVFNFYIRPILGLNYYTNSSGDFTRTYRGAEAFASIGKHISIYADLRDNTVSQQLVQPTFFSNETGGAYKQINNYAGYTDYSEMRGGILFSNNFLDFGLVKDHLIWGDNENGANIFSGHTPSFPMIKLHLNPVKWFDFNYFHAWLISEVIDSSLSYIISGSRIRNSYHNKYLAANLYTIIPLKGLNISFGNSIIYSDMNVQAAYLIPFFFYKSVDHTLTNGIENQNSQLFFNLSLRLIKHIHMYGSVFIDEFSVKRITNPNEHNLYSYKIGSKLNNWPFQNLSITTEYYKSIPITYQHIVPTLTFESNKYSLGHYLRDNSEEKYVSMRYKPLPRFYAQYSYTNARHGNDYQYKDGFVDVTYPILKENTWTSISHSLVCSYEILTNCYISLEYIHSNTQGHEVDGLNAEYYLNKFTPEFFQGMKNTLLMKINLGF